MFNNEEYITEGKAPGVGDLRLNRGTCTVTVHCSNEGTNYPHFHVENNNKKIDCAVMLNHNAFFNHGKHLTNSR